LAIGNYVNNPNKQVLGFRLASLEKLSDVASKIQKPYTLMDFFVQFVQENFPQYVDFAKDFHHLSQAKYAFESFTTNFQNVNENVKAFLTELKACTEEGNTLYVDYLTKIADTYNEKEAEIQELQSNFMQELTFFGEPTKEDLLPFFESCTKFVDNFDKAVKIVESLAKQREFETKKKEAETRREELLKRKEAAAKKRATKQTRKRGTRPANRPQKANAREQQQSRAPRQSKSIIDVNGVMSDVFGQKAEEAATGGGTVRNLVETLRDNASRNFSKLRGSRIETVNDASILDAVSYDQIQKGIGKR